jgi:flagellar hook-length control protein FliK
MPNLPPLPSSPPANPPPVRADETVAKAPAGGAHDGFPRLLAQAPAARRGGDAAAATDAGAASPELPPATAGGNDLPPDAAESPPSVGEGEVVVAPVALPPGLIWSPSAPQRLAADGVAVPVAGVAAVPAASGQQAGPAAGDPGLAAVASPAAFPGAPVAAPASPASPAGMVPVAAPAGMTAPPGVAALIGEEAESAPLPSGAESLLDKTAAGLDVLELGAAARAAPPPATATAATPATQPAATAALDLPVGHAGWDRELGARVLWVVRDQLQHAELRLHPAHLGPLEVRLAVQPDQGVSVQFLSAHAAVRDAVEAALPRLRELFAEGGLTLADANVGAHSSSGQGGERQPAAARERPAAAAIAEVTADAAVPAAGLVDFFA